MLLFVQEVHFMNGFTLGAVGLEAGSLFVISMLKAVIITCMTKSARERSIIRCQQNGC
jgi:hypothetical protein